MEEANEGLSSPAKPRKIREKFTVSCEEFSVPESNRIRPRPLFSVACKPVSDGFLDSGPHMGLKERKGGGHQYLAYHEEQHH